MSNDVSVKLEEDGLTIGIYREGNTRPLRFFLGHKPQVQFAVATSIAREIWREGEGKHWVADFSKLAISLYEERHCTYIADYQYGYDGVPSGAHCRVTSALTLGMANYLCTLLSTSNRYTPVSGPSLRDKVVGLHTEIKEYLSSYEELLRVPDTSKYQTLFWVSKALSEILEDS